LDLDTSFRPAKGLANGVEHLEEPDALRIRRPDIAFPPALKGWVFHVKNIQFVCKYSIKPSGGLRMTRRLGKRGNTKSHKGLTAIDLFSGCGGLTQGLKDAGFKVLAAVELEEFSSKTYRVNHPDVCLVQADIRILEPKQLLANIGLRPGQLDLLAGCPPCQGFSTMRTLNGSMSVDDERNGLLLEFLRIIEAVRPKSIMMENVPGLANDKIFKSFVRRLAKLGYRGTFEVLNTANYGVPQRRRRLIYLASRNRSVAPALPLKAAMTVRDAIGNLPKPGKTGDKLHDSMPNHSDKVKALIKAIPKNGGSRESLPAEFKLKCHKKFDGFRDVYGRMAWDEQSPTITSGCCNPSKGRFLHPSQNRAITLREAALLQGFPKGYSFPTVENRSATALMIGNALPPPFIKVQAQSIVEALAPTD
jgi:DNA (cytosine-5)-methyltransferase 1